MSCCNESDAQTGIMQVPLQPLQDNLELQTYETFERDTPKYTAYEEAIHDALLDRVPQSEAATRTTILMVGSDTLLLGSTKCGRYAYSLRPSRCRSTL